MEAFLSASNGFIVGNRITSRIESVPQSIMAQRSMPKPRPPRYLSAWLKTAAVCLISFFGAAFAIMTFNNDVSVTDAFDQIYLLVTGTNSDGFTILEISYSIGLGLGIVVFFNHFARWKITTDPTPLEVEMRLYEENVCKTLIQNAGRKESGVDVS